jgi:hypothetical protein
MTARNLAPAQTLHWRDFYGLQSWRPRRAQVAQATIVRGLPQGRQDHRRDDRRSYRAHGGDYTKFLLGELQSLREPCHQPKWAADKRGYSSEIGDDGYPVDKNHPFNRVR